MSSSLQSCVQQKMLPSFPYLAMTITGVLHILIGFTTFINAMVGLNMKVVFLTYYELHLHKDISEALHEALHRGIRIYLGVIVASSLWMIMVGILGILTGVKREEHQKTHNLKIAYMATAILSAVTFTLAGISLSTAVRTILPIIGLVGSITSFAGFVLSIVSSSICCCCANSTSGVTGILFLQSPGPSNQTSGIYPAGHYTPGNYSPANHPPPYRASVQIYPAPQVHQEGVTNSAYAVNGVPSNYNTMKEDV